MNRLIFVFNNGVKLYKPNTLITSTTRQFCSLTKKQQNNNTTSSSTINKRQPFKKQPFTNSTTITNNSTIGEKKTINEKENLGSGSNCNGLQKAILLMNIKELFKKDDSIALDLFSKHLKLKTFNDHDVEVLFTWVNNNKYFKDIELINLFLVQFITSNNLSKIQKLIQICSTQSIEMNLTTYNALIKYFTHSNMTVDLISILDSFKLNYKLSNGSIGIGNGKFKDHRIRHDLVGAYICLDDIKSALSNYQLSKPHLPSLISIIRYFQSKGEFENAINLLKEDIESHQSFILSGSFSSMLNNFPMESVEQILRFLLNKGLTNENEIFSIISLHLEKNLGVACHLLFKFSDIVLKPHLFIAVVRQAIILEDMNQICLILKEFEKKRFSLNIPYYQYILEMSLKQKDNGLSLNTIVDHITTLNTVGGEMSKIMFYTQNRDKSQLFQVLNENLEKQSISYIDQITTQIIKHYIHVGNYDYALGWYNERFDKYSLGLNIKIAYAFCLHPDQYLRKFWDQQTKYIHNVDVSNANTSTSSNNNMYNNYDDLKVDQMNLFIESFIKDINQSKQLYHSNNPFLKQNDEIEIKITPPPPPPPKSITVNNNEQQQQQQQQQQEEQEPINQFNEIKQTNNQLQKLIQDKLNQQIIEQQEHYESLYGKSFSREWIPKEFSKGFNYVNSENDTSLSLAIENNDLNGIFSIMKKNIQDNTIPQGVILLSAYYKIYELDQNKYMELLQETPSYIRNFVFNYKFYIELLQVYPDAALYLLQQENPLFYTDEIYNQILEIFVKSNRIDIAIPLLNLMITADIPLRTITLKEITSFIISNNHSTNSTFLIKLIKYQEEKVKSQDILIGNGNNIAGNSNGNNIGNGNSNGNTVGNGNSISGGSSGSSGGPSNDVFKNLTYCYSLLLNELYQKGMHNELLRLFKIYSGHALNYLSVEVMMKSMAKQYPIPPISNTVNWLSIIKNCQGNKFKNYFYQSLFHQLHKFGQSEIINKFIYKDYTIIENCSQSLFESILLHSQYDSKLYIKLFESIYSTPNSFTFISSQNIKNIILNSIDDEINNLIDNDLSRRHQLVYLKASVENIKLLVPRIQQYQLSDESINSISHFAPIILEQYQKKNPSSSNLIGGDQQIEIKQLSNEQQKIEILQYIKLKELNIGAL